MGELKIVTNYDDWEGLYDEGQLVMEGHRLERDHILGYLGITIETLKADNDYLYKYGRLPLKLEDVPLIKEEK